MARGSCKLHRRSASMFCWGKHNRLKSTMLYEVKFGSQSPATCSGKRNDSDKAFQTVSRGIDFSWKRFHIQIVIEGQSRTAIGLCSRYTRILISYKLSMLLDYVLLAMQSLNFRKRSNLWELFASTVSLLSLQLDVLELQTSLNIGIEWLSAR